MKEFQDRPKFRGKFFYGFWSVVIILLIILLARSVFGSWARYHLVARDRSALLGRVANLEERRQVLQAELDKLGTDRGIEASIRHNFSVVKEGEKVITVVVPDLVSISTDEVVDDNWWQKILEIFKLKRD